MPTRPLYQAYLSTRPDDFQPTVDVPPFFEAEEPRSLAKASKTSVLRDWGTGVEDIT